MRTIAYVDGHNLYFNCLKKTQYKWLDLEALLTTMIAGAAPGSELLRVKYFTSPIKGSLSRRGQASTNAQAEYIRALRENPRIAITEGRFSVESAQALRHVTPPNIGDRVKIWRIEEKETDVSLAVTMYRDARAALVDQVVLVSNDSDMVPALRTIRDDTDVRVGVILPLGGPLGGTKSGRRPSATLAAHADWVRESISQEELAAAQLPSRVQTARRPACRPSHW
ncbi:NYN domain-containing protein [Luteibacter pinisoli]|uniref:NYN domain-containing protein n=1 Tax=Luteibacter pinisoli TaxID=2589080 RepID=A0A4Y5Z9V4_9GAMM|nr:NYN domain-containing protein [Luteibacter pinisoli]QDE41329.1 NYN domain-containing protein [Luteibacter pinisoli]